MVYDDDDSPVTLESLNEFRSNAITAITTPNILASSREAMCNGTVTFRLSTMNVLSSMTEPRHRRFRYRLVCVSEPFYSKKQLVCDSPAFYVQAKLKKMEIV